MTGAEHEVDHEFMNNTATVDDTSTSFSEGSSTTGWEDNPKTCAGLVMRAASGGLVAGLLLGVLKGV